MSLVRVQTVWSGVGGAPYYTNLYCIGPIATNNGNDLANAWHAFLISVNANLAGGMVATIQPELLEFNETDGTVTNAGSTTQTPVTMAGVGDHLPHMTQALIQWHTDGIVHNRRVRGRTFLPGVLESENSPTGDPAGVNLLTPLQTSINTLLSTMTGRMRIWSREVDAAHATPTVPARPGSAWPIVTGTVSSKWGILRSRRD
jgi:hypothetical protein